VLVTVRFFAVLRDIVGCDSKPIELVEGGTAGELWNQLEKEYPQLEPFRACRLFAVNCDYATADHLLQEGDEVAILPPLSGG